MFVIKYNLDGWINPAGNHQITQAVIGPLAKSAQDD